MTSVHETSNPTDDIRAAAGVADAADGADADGGSTMAPASHGAFGPRGARCIRCTHDLRGDVLEWTAACPLHGRCSECGLEFAWREVLVENRRAPWWSVERTHRTARWPLRWIASHALVAVVPWYAARTLTMAQPIRGGRLTAAILGWLLAAYVMAASVAWNELATLRAWRTSMGGMVPAAVSDPGRLAPDAMLASLPIWRTGEVELLTPQPAMEGWVQTDVGWFDLRVTQLAHLFPNPEDFTVVRAGELYVVVGYARSSPAPPLWASMGSGAIMNDILQRYERPGRVLRPLQPYRARLVELIESDPPAHDGRAVMTVLVPAAPPDAVLDGLGRLPIQAPYPGPWHALAPWLAAYGKVVLLAVVLVGLSVVSFAILPIARARARVAWRHVLRVSTYVLLGMLGAAVCVSIFLDGRPIDLLLLERAGDWSVFGPPVDPASASPSRIFLTATAFLAPGGVWLAVVWTSFAARYLRMERPWAVGFAVASMSTFGAVGVYTLSAVTLLTRYM